MIQHDCSELGWDFASIFLAAAGVAEAFVAVALIAVVIIGLHFSVLARLLFLLCVLRLELASFFFWLFSCCLSFFPAFAQWPSDDVSDVTTYARYTISTGVSIYIYIYIRLW